MLTIIAHPGSAHRDDFMAVCVLLATLGEAEVQRREPTAEDLADLGTYVVDVGFEYDPARHNFDHHHDRSLPCAFHLVMKHLGLHEAAKEMFVWYAHMSMMDVRGPYRTAEHLGVESSVLFASSSPIDGYILSRFSDVSTLSSGEMLYELMQDIGRSLIQLIELKQQRLALLKAEVQLVPVGHLKALVSQVADNPKLAMEIFLRELKDDKVAICITPSIRGKGWEMLRLGDSTQIDFRKLRNDPLIQFVHIDGFVAKTKTMIPLDQVVQLAERAIANG
jgi:hypothetical protein